MIRCRKARAFILRAVDDDLALEQDLELRAHLADCAGCRGHWERAAALELALAGLPEPPLDSLDVERAVAAVRARCVESGRETGRPRVVRPPRPSRLAAAAALALALFGAGQLLVRRSADSEPAAPSITAVITAVDREPALGAEPVPAPDDGNPRSEWSLSGPTPEAEPLRPERAEAARTRVGAALALGSARELEVLAGEGWPVVRLVERYVDDPDPALARAAAAYLGQHGDRLSARTLAQRLESTAGREGLDSLRDALVEALSAAGQHGLLALGSASREADLARDVLEVCFAVGGEAGARRAREVIETCAAAGREEGVLAGLAGLAGLGQDGFEALLALGVERRVPRERVLDALAAARGGRERLWSRIEAGPAPDEVDVLLAAAGRLGVEAALPWIAALCRERAHAAAACAALTELGSFEALESLFEAHDSGRLVNGEAEQALARLAARSPALLADYVRWQPQASAGEAALECLLEIDAAWVGPALAALAQSPRLEQDGRVWAALAVGEVGALDQLPVLDELLRGLGPGFGRLAAACLLSIHALGGREALVELLANDPQRELLGLLEDRARGRGPTAPLYKLARRIEPLLDPETPFPWRNSP